MIPTKNTAKQRMVDLNTCSFPSNVQLPCLSGGKLAKTASHSWTNHSPEVESRQLGWLILHAYLALGSKDIDFGNFGNRAIQRQRQCNTQTQNLRWQLLEVFRLGLRMNEPFRAESLKSESKLCDHIKCPNSLHWIAQDLLHKYIYIYIYVCIYTVYAYYVCYIPCNYAYMHLLIWLLLVDLVTVVCAVRELPIEWKGVHVRQTSWHATMVWSGKGLKWKATCTAAGMSARTRLI